MEGCPNFGHLGNFSSQIVSRIKSGIKMILNQNRVKWGNLEHMGNLERPCKSSVNGELQVKISACNVSVN